MSDWTKAVIEELLNRPSQKELDLRQKLIDSVLRERKLSLRIKSIELDTEIRKHMDECRAKIDSLKHAEACQETSAEDDASFLSLSYYTGALKSWEKLLSDEEAGPEEIPELRAKLKKARKKSKRIRKKLVAEQQKPQYQW